MAVVGDILTFADNTGALVQDSGVLASALMSIVNGARGIVYMFQPPGGVVAATVPWIVVTPDGSAVPSIGNTHTNGFNETETYAFSKGWSIEVSGGGESLASGGIQSVMTADAGSGGFILKPLAQRYLKLKGVIMQSFAQTTLTVNSMVEAGIFQEGSQILNLGTTGAITVDIAPSTIIPVEGFVGIGASWIQLPNVGMQTTPAGGKASLRFNLAGGGINQTLFDITELNGGGSGGPTANWAMLVENDAVNFMAGCVFRIGFVHNTVIGLIKTGTVANHFSGNVFDIGLMTNATGILIDEFGSFGNYRIGTMNGVYTWGIQSEVAANGNSYVVGIFTGCTSASGNNPGINELNNWRSNYCVGANWLNLIVGNRPRNGLKPTSVTNGAIDANSTCASGFFTTTNGVSTTFALVYGPTFASAPIPIISVPGNIEAWVSAFSTTGFTITTASAVPNSINITWLAG